MAKIDWPMTDNEITVQYRQAANKKDQVSILADMNLVTRAEMAQKLTELGFDVPVRTRGKYARLDREQAMKLYKEGYTQVKIAKELGVSTSTVQAWWEENRLVSKNRGGKREPAKKEPAKKKPKPKKAQAVITPSAPRKTIKRGRYCMDVSRVIEILSLIRDQYPTAVVRVLDADQLRDIRQISLHLLYDMDGPASAFVEILMADELEAEHETD